MDQQYDHQNDFPFYKWLSVPECHAGAKLAPKSRRRPLFTKEASLEDPGRKPETFCGESAWASPSVSGHSLATWNTTKSLAVSTLHRTTCLLYLHCTANREYPEMPGLAQCRLPRCRAQLYKWSCQDLTLSPDRTFQVLSHCRTGSLGQTCSTRRSSSLESPNPGNPVVSRAAATASTLFLDRSG